MLSIHLNSMEHPQMSKISREAVNKLESKDIDINNVTYYDLNNRVNIPLNGQIQLDQDKAALSAFFKENVIPNTMTFCFT